MMLNKDCKRFLGAALITLFVLYPGRHAQSEEMSDAKNLSPKNMIVRVGGVGRKELREDFLLD